MCYVEYLLYSLYVIISSILQVRAYIERILLLLIVITIEALPENSTKKTQKPHAL